MCEGTEIVEVVFEDFGVLAAVLFTDLAPANVFVGTPIAPITRIAVRSNRNLVTSCPTGSHCIMTGLTVGGLNLASTSVL